MVEGRRYVSFVDWCNQFKLQKTFDTVTQKGKVYRGSHYAVFCVGHSLFLIDGEMYRTDYEVRRFKGEILLPAEGAAAVVRKLYDGAAVSLSDSSLEIIPDEGISKKTEKETADKDEQREEDAIGFIVVDAGHGGKDPGAIGKNKIQEKGITLKVAKMLVINLRKRFKDLRVVMTRDKDVFIPLAKRTDIANSHLKKKTNGLFISIHVNASLSDKISGFETYFLSVNPTNEEARKTAALENDVIILEQKNGHSKGYGDVDYIEAMMLTTQIQKESALLADSIQKGMDRSIDKSKSRGVKKADFFVLRGVLMPAALVEIGYITHKAESGILVKKEHQKSVADGITQGVASFIEQYNRMVKAK